MNIPTDFSKLLELSSPAMAAILGRDIQSNLPIMVLAHRALEVGEKLPEATVKSAFSICSTLITESEAARKNVKEGVLDSIRSGSKDDKSNEAGFITAAHHFEFALSGLRDRLKQQYPNIRLEV